MKVPLSLPEVQLSQGNPSTKPATHHGVVSPGGIRLWNLTKRNRAMRIAKGIAKSALALGVAGAMAIGGTAPAAAQINIDVPGVHVHVGRHHRHYYPPPGPGYGPGYGYGGWNTWNGCPPNFTVQDGVCKPYRGY